MAGAVCRATGSIGTPADVDDPQLRPVQVLSEPFRGRQQFRARVGLHAIWSGLEDIVGIIGAVVSPFMPDEEKLAAVREGLPATGAGIYLNTGTAGPIPANPRRPWRSWPSGNWRPAERIRVSSRKPSRALMRRVPRWPRSSTRTSIPSH